MILDLYTGIDNYQSRGCKLCIEVCLEKSIDIPFLFNDTPLANFEKFELKLFYPFLVASHSFTPPFYILSVVFSGYKIL